MDAVFAEKWQKRSTLKDEHTISALFWAIRKLLRRNQPHFSRQNEKETKKTWSVRIKSLLRLRRGLFFLFLSRTRRGSASERKNKCHQTPPCVRPPVVSISNSVLAVKQAVSWTSTTGIPQKLQARRIGGTCGGHYSPDTVRGIAQSGIENSMFRWIPSFFFFLQTPCGLNAQYLRFVST